MAWGLRYLNYSSNRLIVEISTPARSAPTNTQNISLLLGLEIMTSCDGPEVDILNPTNDSDDEDDRGNAPERTLNLKTDFLWSVDFR